MKHLAKHQGKWSFINELIDEEIDILDRLESIVNDVLIGKRIIATDDKLISSLPFRISSDDLRFTINNCMMEYENGEKVLTVHVDNIEGTVTNPEEERVTERGALCMVMTAWVYWEITSKVLPEQVNVIVYM